MDWAIEQSYLATRQDSGAGTAAAAKVWLHAHLTSVGSERKRRVMALAEELGHTSRTVERAAELLNVVRTTVGRENLWSLPEED